MGTCAGPLLGIPSSRRWTKGVERIRTRYGSCHDALDSPTKGSCDVPAEPAASGLRSIAPVPTHGPLGEDGRSCRKFEVRRDPRGELGRPFYLRPTCEGGDLLAERAMEHAARIPHLEQLVLQKQLVAFPAKPVVAVLDHRLLQGGYVVVDGDDRYDMGASTSPV
jgi:hypothetical protein